MPEIISDLVSVVIPVNNRARMLGAAVDSVLCQTWPHFEIIISDDGSTDDTVELGRALEIQHEGVVRYLWNPNRGAGPAREAGRQIARGEFIQYLDSDDTLCPRKFEVQIAALRLHPECGVAYGQIRLCPEDAAPMDKPHKWSGRALPALFPWLLVDRWWNTNAPLWRRSVCETIGPWSDLRYSQDWEYDARAGALGVRLAHCPEYVTNQHQHPGNRQTGNGKWLSPPDQVRFFRSLHSAACKAGVENLAPEMQHFSRWVFSQARKCGALGDAESAETLFQLALQSAVSPDLKMKLIGAAAKMFGWKFVGAVGQFRDRYGDGKTGLHTQKQSWMVG